MLGRALVPISLHPQRHGVVNLEMVYSPYLVLNALSCCQFGKFGIRLIPLVDSFLNSCYLFVKGLSSQLPRKYTNQFLYLFTYLLRYSHLTEKSKSSVKASQQLHTVMRMKSKEDGVKENDKELDLI